MEGGVEQGAVEEEEWEARARAQRRSNPRELASQQIKAVLRRNVIGRRRTKGTTFCELCSPSLLLCVLVYGYSLSDVLVFPEKMYASVRLELPGGFAGLLPFARLHGEDLANVTLSSQSSESHQGSASATPKGDDYEEEEGLSYYDVKEVFDDMTGLLDGPFPVPDLDQFVGLGAAVAGDLGDGAYAQIVDSMESGWTFGNIITQGTLHFAPAANPAVGELVTWLSNTTEGFDVLTHRVHQSEEDAITYALDHLEERTWAVIALDEAADGRVDYTIRMNFTVVPNTNTVVDVISIGLDPSFRSYYLSGFLTLQTTLDRFMFKRALPASSSPGEDSGEPSEGGEGAGPELSCVPPDVVGVPFPTAAYDQNLFYAAVGYLLGLAMTMSTMYPLSRLVKGIVEEKESRVRETMRIMGLRAWTHEVSWLITGMAVFTFIAITVTALLSWTFLPLADGSLLLVFMLSFAFSEVGMALLVSSVFSKAKLASIAAPCVLFAGVLPRYIFYGSNRHEAPRSKTFASLLSPTAFTFGADFIADYEYADIGAGWGNYDEGAYSLRTSIGMMFLDAVLYGALAWYLDKVVPPEYGTSRDPLKLLTSLPRALYTRVFNARWRFSSRADRGWTPVRPDADACDAAGISLEEAGLSEGGLGIEGDPADFEPLEGGGDEKRGVVIAGLRKEFGNKVAVAGLDLRLIPGDITCLLGHNGAGKSTTISMLTGQLGATSGDAIVWGHSVTDSLNKVRQDIGICPQHDALMPLLTAREHIELYMDIKGMPQHLKGPLVTKKLREVGLLEKEHTQSGKLSGGQKRKLSVALALTGSPTLCILDEPTSGMDPYSRRFTWDLLRRGRAGRCTLLSTHFMEEAEHLGDRVAMLRKGRLRCAGSPLFLKSRFGLGYKLTLVKAGETFDPERLTALVLSRVGDARALSSAGGEISFRLPREESQSFPALFRDLETGREALGVGGYGVSITSLEEVFLSLEKEGRLADTAREGSGVGAPPRDNGCSPENCRSDDDRQHTGGEGDADATSEGSRLAASADMASMAAKRGAAARVGCGDGCSNSSSDRSGGSLVQRRGSARAAASMSNGHGGERRAGPVNGSVREIEMQSMSAGSPGPSLESIGLRLSSNNGGGGDLGGHRSSSTVIGGKWNGRSAVKRYKGSDPHLDRLAYDEEDMASLLAEGQEDDQVSPLTFISDSTVEEGVPGENGGMCRGGSGVGGVSASRRRASARETAGAELWEQLCWLLWKRKVVAVRDWRGGLYQVVLPAALVALVLVLLTIDVGLAGPPLAMSAAMFGGPTQVLYVEGRAGEARRRATTQAEVAAETDAWTRLDSGENSPLLTPTSSSLSRFLLDTYSINGNDPTAGDASGNGDGGGPRAPRYGAFVFGDRISLNVTVDWDKVRERPELLAAALQVAGDSLPEDGGEYDLQELMEASGVDKAELARLIMQGSDRAREENGDDDALGFLFPDGSSANNGGGERWAGLDGLNETVADWVKTNWTDRWLDLVDEDPTVRFTEAEYLPQSEELRLEGVVLVLHLENTTQTVELGEVEVSVDDILRAVPPGTRRYDKGVMDLNDTTTTVMFNTTAPHALPAWVGEITAKTFESCARQRGMGDGEAFYTTRSHPLPLTATESLEVQTMLSLLVSLLVTIPLCYAPAAFVSFLVRERACKSKRVQLVSGASPLAYWLSAYVWDVLLFFVLTVLVMLAFAAYGRDASKVFMMHWDALVGTWGLLISYGLSALPLSYLYSFAFDGPSSAQISIAGVNFLTGFGFVIAYAVLVSLKKTAKFAAKAQHMFRLFPPYLLGDGLIKVSSEFYLREVLGMQRKGGVLAWDVAGKAICYMCLEAVGYLALVLVVEYSLAVGVRAKADRLRLRLGGWFDQDLAAMLAASRGPGEDCDVKEERLRVDRAMSRGMRTANPAGGGPGYEGVEADTVLIRGLTKVYPAPMSSAQQRPKCAVRGLSLGVKRGECFGLLGINGAGKSTTLQILTRDLQATSGNVRVDGKLITSGAVCRLLGYCPQTDPLLPLMTVNETLLFFGGLKGIASDKSAGTSSTRRRRGSGRDSSLQKAAAAAQAAVSLGPTENQLAGTLSGGNKRKLSLAVALIGDPSVLLLDEPSSGMDPGARRSMWEVISSLSASRSVVLTTHSMEECEAVCDRLGIMVGGRLRCLGTSQHLKGRFGGGYSIEVRCPTTSMTQVTEMIRGLSPLARLEEMHPTLVKFSIPAGGERAGLKSPVASTGGWLGSEALSPAGLSLSSAFEMIEARKDELQVWDYSINQATLETIFMSFAKDQEEETASVPGVSYADTPNRDVANRNIPTQETRFDGRDRRPAASMDVEMAWLGNGGNREGSENDGPGADGEISALL